MTLELATAALGALFVFCLILLFFRGDGGMPTEIPAPKNPIGFAPSA